MSICTVCHKEGDEQNSLVSLNCCGNYCIHLDCAVYFASHLRCPRCSTPLDNNIIGDYKAIDPISVSFCSLFLVITSILIFGFGWEKIIRMEKRMPDYYGDNSVFISAGVCWGAFSKSITSRSANAAMSKLRSSIRELRSC